MNVRAVVLLLAGSVLIGCQILQEVSNLKDVQFRIDRVSEVRLSGVDVGRVESFGDLSGADVARLGAAVSRGKLPLSFTLHVEARNPESNELNARLTKMGWRLFLNDRETVSGTVDREVVLPPGAPKTVSIDVQLDLVDFFDENLQDLVGVAAAVAGKGPPTNIKLKVQPTIQTRVGPMRYPSPIVLGARERGSEIPSLVGLPALGI